MRRSVSSVPKGIRCSINSNVRVKKEITTIVWRFGWRSWNWNNKMTSGRSRRKLLLKMSWERLHCWLSRRWRKSHNYHSSSTSHSTKCSKRPKPSTSSSVNAASCSCGYMHWSSHNWRSNYKLWTLRRYWGRTSYCRTTSRPMSITGTTCLECRRSSRLLWSPSMRATQ